MTVCNRSTADIHWCGEHRAEYPEGQPFCRGSGISIEASDTAVRAYRIEAAATRDELAALTALAFAPLRQIGGGYAWVVSRIQEGGPSEVHIVAWVPEPFADNLPAVPS